MRLVLILFISLPFLCFGQDYTEQTLIDRLLVSGTVHEDVLSKRSVVIHASSLTAKEINTIHENMIKIGIDAVAYFNLEKVLSGKDMTAAYARYFDKREIGNLILVQKSDEGYAVFATAFNDGSDLVNKGQAAWKGEGPSLNEILTSLYRTALSSAKQKNLLINDVAETDLPVTLIGGQRAERFAYDLKADKLAIQKFGDPERDKALEELLKVYPLPYEIVDNTIPETDLRKKGFLYILCYANTTSSAARSVLDYQINPSESAFVSVTYPEGQLQLKNISANTSVYKFYVRHIDSGNIFLGTKWDADTTWEQALKNYITGFKVELKIN